MIHTNKNINLESKDTSYFTTKKSYEKYKKSRKQPRKQFRTQSRKQSYQTKYIFNTNLGKQIIACYNKSIEETAQNLNNLITKNINNKQFEEYEKNTIPFDEDIQGKSGALVGYLKNEPNTVIKINYYNHKPNFDFFFNIKECLQINNKLNEIIINNILNNLESLNVFSKKEIEEIKPYILELKGSGFSDKGIYILLPLVGFEYKITPEKTKYVTNLTDILVLNHKELLDKAIKNKDYHIISLYDEYLSLMLTNYFKILYLLNSRLDYINTDLKLNNIFISRKTNNNVKFQSLKTYGFEIDFNIIISDLEKSIYKINNIKTITIPNKPLKVKFADIFGYGLIYRIRYECITDFEKKCKNLKSRDYDILFMIINILVILHRNNNFTEMKNYLDKTLDIIKKTLNINNNDLEIFLKIISKNVFNKDKNVQFYLNIIISKICKNM